MTFPGFAGDPVRAWLLVPHQAGDGAAVVQYVGYGGGRGDPFDWLTWSCAGHPHLIMDCRGQGGSWRSADTADVALGRQLDRGPRGYAGSGGRSRCR